MQNLRRIFEKLAWVLISFAAIHIVFSGALAIHVSRMNRLDTELTDNVFAPEPVAVVMGRDLIRKSGGKKIVLLGSSNVREGFRPELIEPALPEYSVHNLAVGASNITQIRQIVELTYEVLSSDERKHTTLVVGIWFGNFVENAKRWGPGKQTDIQVELKRYGGYEFKDHQILPVSTRVQDLRLHYLSLFGPYTLLRRLFVLASGIQIRIPYSGSVDDEFKKRAFAFWREYMGSPDGSLGREQFDAVIELAQLVEKNGGKLVILDLPIPKWHQSASLYLKSYESLKSELIKPLFTNPRVRYMDLRDLNENSHFYDSAHPTKQAALIWSTTLKEELLKLTRNVGSH